MAPTKPATLACFNTTDLSQATAVESFDHPYQPMLRVESATNDIVLLCCSRPRLVNVALRKTLHFLVPSGITDRYAMAYDYHHSGVYMAVCWRSVVTTGSSVGLLRWPSYATNESVPVRPEVIFAYTAPLCPRSGVVAYNPTTGQVHALLGNAGDEDTSTLFTYNTTSKAVSTTLLLQGFFGGLSVDPDTGDVLSVFANPNEPDSLGVVTLNPDSGHHSMLSVLALPVPLATMASAPFYFSGSTRLLYLLAAAAGGSSGYSSSSPRAVGAAPQRLSTSSSSTGTSGGSGVTTSAYSSSTSSGSSAASTGTHVTSSSGAPSSTEPAAASVLMVFDADTGAVVMDSPATPQDFGRHAIFVPMNTFE